MPVLLHEALHELHLRALVRRVAGHDLVGEREPVGREHERDHDLKAVAAPVAAVAVAQEVRLLSLRPVHLEVRTCQVVEDHSAVRREESGPAVAQELEHPVLVRDEPVEAGVQRGLRREGPVTEEVAHRRAVVPLAVHAPFAPGVRQAVQDDCLEHREPVRAVRARRKATCPEPVQADEIPKIQSQPARAPFADVLDRHLVQADSDGGARLALLLRLRRDKVTGGVFRLPLLQFVYGGQPGVLPVLVYLAEIQELPLHDARPGARVLRDAPVVVPLAVLESRCLAQKHQNIISYFRAFARAKVFTTRF